MDELEPGTQVEPTAEDYVLLLRQNKLTSYLKIDNALDGLLYTKGDYGIPGSFGWPIKSAIEDFETAIALLKGLETTSYLREMPGPEVGGEKAPVWGGGVIERGM